MKKFYAGTTKGVSATQVKATDLLAIELNKDTTVEEITAATGGVKVLELISNALAESRAAYAITSPFAHVKETVAAVLQSKLNERINSLIDIVENSADGVEAIDSFVEDGRINRDVVEYISDMVEARKAEREAEPVEVEAMVIEKGCNLTEQQVLAMMGVRGLFVGAPCTVPAGEAFVLGFKATSNGVMVVVAVDGNTQPLTYMAAKVQGKEENKTISEENVQMTNNKLQVNVSAANQNTIKEENVQMTTTAKAGVPSLQFVPSVTNEEARAIVDAAVNGADVAPWELTAEERAAMAEAKLQEDLAKFKENQEAKSEQASATANSAAAQALKGMVVSPANKQTPATPVANTNAAAPVVAPVAQVRTNAQPTKTNNRGGNVQMTNANVQTQGAVVAQGRQGSAVSGAFAGGQVSGRQGSAPSLTLGGSVMANNNPALAGWAGIESAMGLIQVDEYVGRGTNGNRDFVWYLEEAAKYEGQIMTATELNLAGFKNEALGITDIKFYTPASVAGLWGREAADNDFMYVEVFFGMTSYEFRIKKGTMERKGEQRPYIFSTNIARKQANNGGAWYCEYVAGRREDKLQVVVQADGVVRMARTEWNNETRTREVVAADAPYVQEVGGANWVNQSLYGTKVGQPVFVQVMMLMDEVSGLKAARDAK